MDTKLCRSCMKEGVPWEFANYDRGIMFMFRSCTNIQINEHDNLPKQFCYNCTTQIESSYKFIQTARDVHEKLIQKSETLTDIRRTMEFNDIEETTQDLTNTIELIDLNDTNETDDVKEMKKKKKTESQQFSCTICKKTFQSKVWFEKHTQNYHSQPKYSCPECSKTFRTQSRLSAHAVTHSAARRFACACGRRYKRRKELAAHARTHAAARPYVCDHCDMGFKLKSVLKSHLVLHQGEKPYLCSVCGWRFAQAGNLSAHMRTHTGAKPHACPCGFRAAAASSLRRHQRRHRAARPHRCRSCRRAFHDKAALDVFDGIKLYRTKFPETCSESCQLKDEIIKFSICLGSSCGTRHERSHTGARPYRCPACERSFADSWKRKCHLMRAHSLPLASIPRMRADPTDSMEAMNIVLPEATTTMTT